MHPVQDGRAVLDRMRTAGYVFRRAEELAVEAILARAGSGIRALLLEGPSGTGKTFLAECLALALGMQEGVDYHPTLLHHWTTDEDILIGVDVGAIAAGVSSREEAYRPGALLRGLLASQHGPALVCLDEVDKAPPRVDALMLDFLQHGRIIGPRGEVFRADPDRLLVILTSNRMRRLQEPLERRCYRVRLDFLPEHVERNVLGEQTGAPRRAVRVAVQMANAIRTAGASSPSLAEIRALLRDLRVARSAADVDLLLQASLIKMPEDEEALRRVFGNNPAATLWGEWRRGEGR
jgi:MoxR-like ATPase